MAKGDLRIPRNFDYGPFAYVEKKPLTASETFARGEPVYVTSAGKVKESGDDPTAVKFAGIALASGDTVGASDVIGTFRQKVGQFKPGASPNLPQTDDTTPFLVMLPGCEVECDNFATDGAGTLATPTQGNAVGEVAGLSLTAGQYTIDVGTTNILLRIIDVLDANGESILRSGKTGVTVRAVVVTSQFAVVTAASA